MAEQVVISLDLVTAVLDILGICGNLLCFVLLLRCVSSASLYVILRALAISDSVFLLSHLLFQLATFYDVLRVAKLVRHIGYTYIGHVAITATVWTTVLVSVERLVAVVYPLHHSRLFSKRCVKIYLLLIWISSALFRVPGFLQRLPPSSTLVTNSTNSWNNYTTEKRAQDHDWATWKRVQVVLWTVDTVASISLVCLCNAITLVTMVTQVKHHNTLESDRRTELQVTMVPLLLVALFLLSELPKKICGVLLLVESLKPTVFNLLVAVCDLCTVLNSSANILVYVTYSSHVRRRVMTWLNRSDSKHVFLACTVLQTEETTNTVCTREL